jgi:bifunctional DNase/RNase
MDEIGNTSRIRMSDAVLLSLISKIPLYIEENLMNRQCFPYNEKTQYQLSIPINTMNLDHLKRELEKAVDEENYELASHLRDEIKRRNERV